MENQEQLTDDEAEDLAAIEETLQDRVNGDRGRPFDDVMAELRREYNLAPPR